MNILSIHAGHNAGIAIFRDDQLVLNWELERYTRVKHDYGFVAGFLGTTNLFTGVIIVSAIVVSGIRGMGLHGFRKKAAPARMEG